MQMVWIEPAFPIGRAGKKTRTCLEPAKSAQMGMSMGSENGKKKKRYRLGIAKIGKGVSVGPTCPIPILSIPDRYPPPYKTHTLLLKVLIYYLYFDILLVALNSIVLIQDFGGTKLKTVIVTC